MEQTWYSYSNGIEQVQLFKYYMNTRHPNITYTFEKEENNSFSFLDVKVDREKGKFVTSSEGHLKEGHLKSVCISHWPSQLPYTHPKNGPSNQQMRISF